MLTTLANAAGVAIDNARLYHDSRRREGLLEALSEVNRSLFAGTEAREVLRLVARRASEVADADLAAVLLPTPDSGDRLTVGVAHGPDTEHIQGMVGAERQSSADRADADSKAYGPTVTVPLPLDASGRDTLRLSRRADRPAFDDTEVALVARFADQAAIALELARRRAESEELAVLHERDRIARDLHDLAIQWLFGTGMTLRSATRMIERPDAAERVARAVKDLDTTVRIIQSTIFELRSAGDDRRGPGLRRRMPETARLATQSLGFSPSLQIDGPVDSTVPADVAEHVLAVTAEALSNIARHARARHAEVVLAVSTAGDVVTLTVTDDGVGMAGAEHTGGLANLRSRAEQCGGALTVESPPGDGTRLVWQVPLPAD